jgi:nicotinate-nucleotide adenylyltransferase
VLGGTFDPPHVGHLVLADRAREQLDLARILWVPAGDPWRKAGRALSAAEHRAAMVSLAIEGEPAFELSRAEIEREGPTYSVDTLRALHGQYPGAELVFLLGADALRDLPHWHEPAELIELARLGVAARGDDLMSTSDIEGLLPGLAEHVLWVDMPRLDISSTELRERAAAGKSLRYLVPHAVETYIRKQGLYRPGA